MASGLAFVAYLVLMGVLRHRAVELLPRPAKAVHLLPQIAVISAAILYWGLGRIVPATVFLASFLTFGDVVLLWFVYR